MFQKALSYIPQSLTSAMLAGVLLKFGISLFASLQNDWIFVLSLLAIYVITKKIMAALQHCIYRLGRYCPLPCLFKLSYAYS
ncbi:benzoate/H(+) symporter BenE family transporter [Acinetobacter baumannii]|nr:benzoate/H(+) symporter BenE family transporter [Acinetobacter baumannii]